MLTNASRFSLIVNISLKSIFKRASLASVMNHHALKFINEDSSKQETRCFIYFGSRLDHLRNLKSLNNLVHYVPFLRHLVTEKLYTSNNVRKSVE